MYGKLYLVATPIGNLEDITLRAIRILKEVDTIVAEDTRQSLKLLNHLEIQKNLISYHRHSKEEKQKEILKMLTGGKNIALISDAGTPVISDPGEEIVKLALEIGIEVVPIPGACALISALIASGIDAKEFCFLGFLPLAKKLRAKKLREIGEAKNTVILYEAPHKIIATLKDLEEITCERRIVLARELTKIHEEFVFGTAKELLDKNFEPRGEYVIIIEKGNFDKEESFINMSIEEHYMYYENLRIY
jgi:16S rRNA (cytidine1402-2'-O)-methyltransferase